jgi:ankyrin repeat protein
MQAIVNGKLLVARVLRAAGADLHRRDDTGTAMHYAAASGSIAVVKWLQSLGHNTREPSDKGLLPLHIACQYKHTKLVQYLLDLPGGSSDVHAQCPNGQTALHTAVHSGVSSTVQLLLQRGADANALFAHGTSALMLATTVPVTKQLLAAGASASAADSMGMTVQHHHAKGGTSAGVVCLTIQAGADPTALDKDGSTPAHIAGMSGHFALEALLSRAAEDYCKKHPAVVVSSASGTAAERTVNDSSGSSNDASGTTAAAGDSHSKSTITASSGSSTTTSSNVSSDADITAAISCVASKGCQERSAPVSAVSTADDK